jgi:hypothetical protein
MVPLGFHRRHVPAAIARTATDGNPDGVPEEDSDPGPPRDGAHGPVGDTGDRLLPVERDGHRAFGAEVIEKDGVRLETDTSVLVIGAQGR